MLRVGSKHIEINEALQVYRDRKKCKRHFGINNKEYNELLTKMLAELQNMAEAEQESARGAARAPKAPSAPSASGSARCQVQSYEDGTSQYASLDNFSGGILPASYAPVQSTQMQAESLMSRGAGPMHAADMHEAASANMTTHMPGTGAPTAAHGGYAELDRVDTNRNLMDRRFFSGSNPTPMDGTAGHSVMPLRFHDTTNMQYRDMQRHGTDVTQDHADHRIFSRTFDLTPGQLPDITRDRQSVGTRRGPKPTSWDPAYPKTVQGVQTGWQLYGPNHPGPNHPGAY